MERRDTGWLYVVEDYVEGDTLGEWLEKTHPTAHEVVALFVKLASALAHVHSRGVFHRDSKLNNSIRTTDDVLRGVAEMSGAGHPSADAEES
jgi:serine/threonine protein kinase